MYFDLSTIPEGEYALAFSRSSGAGGQNVNKVNSRAELRLPVRGSPYIPEHVQRRLLERLGNRMTQEGVLLISSQRFRDQGRNISDCHEKLQALVAEALHDDPLRRPTRPTRGSVERRVSEKKHRARVKQDRRSFDG